MTTSSKVIGLILCVGGLNAFADFANPTPLMMAMAKEFSAGAVGGGGGLDPATTVSSFKMATDLVAPNYAPLTDDQEMAVAYYTENGYIAIDHYLTSGSPLQAVTVQILDSALKALPVYVGDVIHMDNVPAAKLPLLVKGRVLSYPAYLSTSKQPMGFPGSIRFRVHQKSGRDISKYSMLHYEQEVLIPHGSRFRVDTGLHQAADGVNEVEITQL